ANNPASLKAMLEHRANVMNQGELDPVLKEWLAWATVSLGNNVFGIKTHTARLKKMGVTNGEIIEALTVLGYFTGINAVINGLAMDDDVDPAVIEYLNESE
ncbi:MAG TPA: carboxymuconolactone decarboxylase family protein, partial [Thermomicrobiaceae bacterium]|nr:carboxymuconolactone decarboxylase family protein [Thermomicrobiaceae bacterium]